MIMAMLYTPQLKDLDLMARIINAECGAAWCEDEMLYYTGSVVLNRVDDDRFPDTIEDVIYQPGQYSPTWSGSINNKPSDRCIEIAKDLLDNGSMLPSDVVFQANFTQGTEVYAKVQTMYFCRG